MYGGLNFLLRCNYDSKFLERTGMPQFYNSMLQFFLELKSSYESDLGQDLVLFNNKEILIDQKTFFTNRAFKKEFSGYTTSQVMAPFFRMVILPTSMT